MTECGHRCKSKADCKHKCCKRHLPPSSSSPTPTPPSAAPLPAAKAKATGAAAPQTPDRSRGAGGKSGAAKAASPAAAAKKTDAATPKDNRPCAHRCRDKAACKHVCCKRGTASAAAAPRPTPVKVKKEPGLVRDTDARPRRAERLADVIRDIARAGKFRAIETLKIAAHVPLPSSYIYEVQNVTGSSVHRRKAFQGGWIRLYEEKNPTLGVPQCAVKNCGGGGDVGAHVWILGLPQHDVYFIVPMCHKHNHDHSFEEGATRWAELKTGVRPLPITKHESL